MNKLRFIIGIVVLISFLILINGAFVMIRSHKSEQALPVAATATIIVVSGISLILFDMIREQQYSLDNINKEIGARINLIRKKRGISIQDLALKSSIPKRSLSLYEKGKGHITDRELVNLSYALGVSVLFLKEGKNESS